MNKIFKVIWSKSKQCYIVVSEMAKNHSGKKKIVVASILAAMAVGTTVFVEAARVSLGGGVAETEGSIAIGTNSFAKGTSFPKGGNTQVDPSIAIGTGATAEGNSSLAIGLSATVDKKSYAVAIGRYTKATDDYGIGIGYNVRADLHGVAVGEQARALKEGATTLGVSSRGYGKGAIAIGWQSLAGADVYTAGVPGNDINNDSPSKINDYNKWGDMSVGLRALATGGNATALGRNAAATATNAVAIGGGNGNNYDDNTERTQATAEKAVAIGYKALASDKNATSIGTDAQASKIRSTAIGYEVRATGNNAVAIGSSDTDARKVVAAGESAIAVGTKAQANNDSSTAIGKEALAGNTNAIALGTSAEGKGAASTAIGNSAQATKTNAIALGTEAEASEAQAVAIGKGATAEKSDAVALGTSATSGGVNGVAIGNDAQAKAADAIAVGSTSRAETANDNAFGNAANASGGGSTAVGYMVNTSGNQAFGAGSNTSVSGIGAVGIGYKVTSTGNRATAVGALAQSYSTSGIAIGDNATVGVAEVKDSANRVTTAAVDAKHGVAIGTNAKVLAGQGSVALGWSTQVTADDVVNSSTDVGANRVSPYLLEGIGEDNSNDKGNGIVAIGTKRTAGGSGFARRLTGVAGAIQDYDAVNLKQLKALESKERHIKVKTGNDAYTPDANGKITLNYVNGKGEDIPNEVTEIKDVAKKSDEWTLRTQDGNTTAVATPQTVNGLTKKAVTLKAGDNIAIENNNGTVTIKAKDVVKSVTSGNTNALSVNTANGAVTITPNIASSVGAAGEDNKLVTSGKVKTALDAKIDKTAEVHIKSGEYTVNSDGIASLIQQNGNNQDQSTRVTIKDIAKKSVVDTLQSDFNTFKAKAITFTGDDNQGVARTLDTTLTVKGGANYTSTTANTNIRVEKDGTTGLAVKLSDKLTGMKEIAGTSTQDLVIKNGDTKVTVKAPTNGDKGTVDFGDAKVVASNLDASIKYRANDEAVAKAKSVKLADGFNFVASNVTDTATEGPKSGLAIKAEDNGKVTFGLDKATRNTIDNAADKNLSNLTQDGKNKVTELAKIAAKEAVKVAPGHNTTVATDTSTAGVTTYTVHANDTTVAAGSEALTINNATPDTNKVRAYTVDLSAATKGKLAAVGNLANVIGGTSIAADGRVTGPTFSITNADGTAENAGTIKEAIEKLDAANKGQNTKISETAEKVTKLGETVTNNYNELSKKISDGTTNITNTLTTKGLDFTGNDTTAKVHRDLGTTLTIKGAENFTRAATETNNIKVVKNGDALDVKLAENLTNMKEISGDGTSDLVIKNGNTKVTVKAPANGDKGTVDFGDAKVIAKNLDASIAYKSNQDTAKKTVKLQDGFNFNAATETTTTAEGPKSGLTITTGDNGVVTFGLDKATRSTIDNAADKNLSNLSDAGKDKVKELAKGAAQDAVKVADGINTTVEKDTATAGVTTYKVNANDTTVAVTGNGLAITGGDLGTDKVRKYSLDLSDVTKGKLKAVDGLSTVIGGTNITADGTVTGPTFSITKADGTNETANTLKDAIDKLNATNAGQNTKISETAGKVTTLEGKVTNLGDTVTNNYNELSNKITQAGTNVTNALTTKGLNFTGNDTTDAGKVHRDLGETLMIKGAENFTRAATETNNIKVVKNGDALDVKLAENLTNMKEISGDGTSDLVIKNGNTKVTVKAPANGDKGTVDFGDAKVIAKNLDASIAYKAGNGDTKKTVKLQDGFNFTAATDTAADTDVPKSGLAITTGANGVVTFGLDKATREKVDNTADKNLSNLSDDGKNKVKELAKGAAQDAVKVADGINTTVEKDTATAGVTTYKVNANDTTVAVTGNGLAITGGDLGTDKVRKYSLDLSDATKGKLKAVDGLSTVIGGTNITADGTVTGPTFSITKADGTNETANTLKDAIDKLNATNAGQNTKISETAGKVTTLEGKVDGIVEKGMVFAGDDATADKVTRKLGETLNIHGQNNITVKKDGTAADTLNVKLASELKNITSISSGNGTTGSTVTLGADGVSIANTKDGATKTVTIGKDGINAGGMKVTNVAKAEADGDAANKKYVDEAISNLGNIVSGNATLNFAGNVTKDAQDQSVAKVGLSLATGTLHVNGAENEIATTAKGDTITVGLAETVKAQLAKVGDTASNGRDGKDGTSGAKGLTGKDGLNDKTLTDKVNALRNGEAGSVVYTNDAGDRVVKAKDGKYYKADEVKADGTVKTAEENKGKAPKVVENPQARVVNGNGETTAPTTLSNIADGKVAADSKEAVNGGQLYTAKSEIGAIIGGTTINENGKITGPTFSITNAAGTKDDATTIKDAIEKLDATNAAQNTKISGNTEKLTQLGEKVTENYNDLSTKITQAGTNVTNALTTKGLDFTGNDTTDAGKVHRDLGTTLTIKGTENFTRAAAETNNIKVVKNGDALDVKLAENLANMKEIAGNETNDLVIKNGNTTVTVKAPTNGDNGTVDFGKAKVVAPNLDASIKYRANDEEVGKAKSVKLADGFNFVASKDATTTAEGPKSGLAISTEDNGKVTFGLDKATRSTIDNAADKDLSNLTDTGKNTVKELAKGAAQDAVKVADGINTTVTTDTTTAGVTTYKVNANDTTVAVNADTLAISGGELGTDKVRKYSLDLSVATKGKLAAVGNLATNVIGGTTVNADGTVVGPKFNINTAADTTEEATTIKDAIDKLNATNAGQNTKISETAGKVTTLEGKVDGIVEKGMAFAGDDATADKVTRKLGETLNIHGQNNITVKKDGTAEDTLNVKLANDLKNITSISSGDGTTGSKVTLGADGVSIANTAAGQDGVAGETKTVTIGKDGINAGGMKVTNVAKAEADGDAANKKYVDEAISNLDTTIRGNATLNFAGNVTKDAQDQAAEKVGLSLATGTLHVNGANNEITTTAKGDTITVGLAETVKAQLAKVGDTSSNGRDGKDGASGAKGLTGKDGLNDKTLTDKVNALRNGEAGSVVYTDENGARLVKAKDGQYYKATDVDATGNVLNNANPATTVEARVVNPDGTTTGGTTKLSNIADGKVAAGSKDAVNGGQLNTVKTDLATALGGGAKVENGVFTGPTYNITKDDGTGTEPVNNVGDAISKLDSRINNANTTLSNKGLDFTGNDTTAKVHRNLGETLTIKGAENFTRTATETNNIKVVKTDNDLDVKLAENLGNIKSISNATGAGKPGSTITLGADGVSIANTAAGADGAAGETKTVTIGKDGINAGGMKITNVAKATENGDAANKEYVDDAIKNLNTTVTNNANLRYAGDTNVGAANGEDHLNLPLATGTLKVAGTADQIKTVANNGTITLSLDEKVANKLNKLGDTASNGRDGANGTSGATGLTGKDGLNDKTLTDKVNALRNGEAGSVVYTDENGVRLVKAKDGEYYKATDVDATGNVLNGAKPATTVEARVVNPNGTTTGGTTKLSNIADGKVAEGSKDAVNGGQLNTVKSDLATALGGGAKVENGVFTGPTYNITKADGTGTETASNVGEAISKLDTRITTANGALVTKGLDFTGNDTTAKVHRDLGATLTIKGAENFTRTAAETNNIKVVKTDNDLDVKLAENLGNIKSISNTTGEGKPGSTITLGANGVSIANTAAGQDGAAGETKTVTIGKDGINAGGMTITNVGEAKAEGDAANKKYVDDAINNLNTTVTNNANLRYAGDTNEGVANGEDHLNLPLATGTLKVAGTADQIKTVANNGTITLSLDEKVANKLNKLGDTASNGRDGANGTSGATGLTGKDGLNDKTLTDKVNALRNGEAGTVVYTDDAGERLVKANDGKWYHKDDLKADGTPKTADENNGTEPKAVDNPQARVVNPNGDTKAPTTLSNIADGKVAANSKEAVNGGQLNTVKSDLATALGGGAKVENGTFTGPTYNITKDDGSNTKEAVNNVGDAISKLDGRINNANTTLGNKGLDFYGNKDTADTDKVHRNLGEALKVKGGENFTREANAKNNIDVVKNTAGDGFDVKLAENLGNIKEIAGNGKDNLVIKNGDATITLKPKKEAEGTNPATPATVDFGDTKVVASNLDASIKYRANDDTANAKSVKLADGFNFVASNVTDTAAEGPKSGLAITAEDNGKVTFGLDKATREKVDNAADKNLSNLSDDGKNKVKELAKGAAQDAVKVADGINTTVTTDTATTGVTTYKVNANDTTVAVNADSLAIAGGDLDATTKVRAYTLDLSDTVKAKLNAITNVGDTASNGRDGVNGTSGAQGLTGKDGLNDKTLTDKVNALRNGEAGSVVYTNEAGDRVVKAKDGKYYKADEVKADGTVKTAEENKGKEPEEVKTPQARVVNPNGETTAPTTLSNIADGKVAADSKEAVNGGQLNTVKSDLATALGGGAKVENGTFTGPTYNITKDDGTGTEPVKNVGDAISKLDGRINNANTVLGNKGLDFTGNDTTDAGKVHRNLGETLTIKGADNFTRTDAETNNIKVVKNNNDLDVKLAENLGNIKEIAGNGKDDLVIKNGDATITLKPKKEAEGTNPATPATVDFGNTKVVAPNLEASITYRANSAEDADAKTVTLQKGLNFVSGNGTAATAEAAKAGITIAADKDGKVVFGLNEATRNAIDNAADKNLSNLSQDGKDKVADLAKTAARDAVKVAAGNNVTVTPETKDGNTTYTVSGRDTTVKAADNGSVSVTGGTLNAKGEREYTVDLTADAKAELGKISDLNTRLGSAEGKITTLQGDMTKAKDDIAANTKAIEANKEAIATNKNAIADNARDIAANTKDIDTNKQGIAENKKQIGENAKAIAKNAEDIKKNVEDTKKNTQDIKENTDAIKANTDRIHTVETRVDTAEGKIAANEKAIKDNASAIQSNTKAIGTNTTAIAKNASDITKANKEIESLKGNSATKDLSNLTNTGKDTITKLIDVKGENGITVTPSTNTDSRVKTFTAKLNDTVTFGSGDKKITVDGTTGTVTSKAVAADTVKANTVNAKTVQLGDSTGTNTTVTADGIAVTTKKSDGTTSKVEIKNGTVSGLTNTKWDPAKVVTDADRGVVATQGQVKDVTDTLARGRVFVGDTGKTVTVGLGDTLAIKGGATGSLTDGNIGVVSTEAKDGKPATMTVKLAKDVKMKDGSTSYDSNVPEIKINPDGSKEIVKNADGTVKYQTGEDGKPIHLTTTVNAGGVRIVPNQGSGISTVSLTAAGLDNGGHQIHNVAAGTANTDAATVGQVRAAAHALNNRVNEAGAHAAALAAMNPLSYDPLKKSQVMAGYGAYKGSNALALGVAHYANEDTLFNVGVSVGNGENMVNAGVTYRFGGEDSMIPERYKGGPISSVYVMQDEITALKAENARKDTENAKKEAENEEMKAQIKMLIERVTMLEGKK